MKKYIILGIIMMLFGSVSAQKKELRNAGKELDKGNFEKAIFPYKYPGLFSMTTSFLFIFLISKIDKKNVDENKFYLLVKQSYLGRK